MPHVWGCLVGRRFQLLPEPNRLEHPTLLSTRAQTDFALGVPTDPPQRWERVGCTEEILILTKPIEY